MTPLTPALQKKLAEANQGGPPHVCTAETCPPGGNYYVSASSEDEFFLMAGPYQTHAEALAHKQVALDVADKHDPRAWFMSWGTLRLPVDYTEPGTLNKHNLMPA